MLVAVAVMVPVSGQVTPRPSMQAHRVDAPPQLDGAVLDEPLWEAIDPVTGFVQVEPFEGQPASEKTEVRIAFDNDTLYIGVVCFDSEPEALAMSDSRRDASLSGEDSIRVILDTFHDRQNGFVFGTNVAGIQYDGQVTNEGRSGGGRGRGGPGGDGGVNLNWDTSWEVRTQTGEFGWSAELAIPFRSLRYGSGNGSWGINFERNIRRKSERAFWAPLGRQFSLLRVSQAGSLHGVEAPKQRNLRVLPYVLASGRDDGISSSESMFDGGLDVKYGLTPSLTLDLTVNTDFAQVEVDDQQINLDRFSLFFPEKRPFFLENAGLFNVGSSGGGFDSAVVNLFFSRRIGLVEGESVPILAGARVSGKVAGLNLGFLAMQTDSQGDLQANNFTVARLTREYPNRSRAGILIVNRQGTGSLAPENDYNRTFAVDGQIGIGEYAEISGWVSKTSTPGLTGRDRAFSLDGNYSSPSWRWRAGYSEVGNEFNPEVGFLSRRDYRRVNGMIMRRFRPVKSARVKEFGPQIFFDSFWNFDGFHETERVSLGGQVELRNGSRISLSGGGNLEGLQEPFEIRPGIVIPPGTYRNNGFFIFLNTNRGRAVSLFGLIQGGGFFDGDQVSVGPSLNVRLGDFLSSQLSWSHNDIDLLAGSFQTNLGRLRVTYAFSTAVQLQALIQYNDDTDDVSTNLRFSWLGEANTGLFVVYNEIRDFGMFGLPQPDRSVIIKYNRVFDVFR